MWITKLLSKFVKPKTFVKYLMENYEINPEIQFNSETKSIEIKFSPRQKQKDYEI